jgi:hypothetical protein
MGAPPPPTPSPVKTPYDDLWWVCQPTANCRLITHDWLTCVSILQILPPHGPSRCGWHSITCCTVAALSAWSQAAWEHRCPQRSYCRVSSLLDADVMCSSVTFKRGRGHMSWYPWKCVYRAISSQRLSLLIKLFRLSAGMSQHIKVKVKVMLRPTVSRPDCLGIKRPSGA